MGILRDVVPNHNNQHSRQPALPRYPHRNSIAMTNTSYFIYTDICVMLPLLLLLFLFSYSATALLLPRQLKNPPASCRQHCFNISPSSIIPLTDDGDLIEENIASSYIPILPARQPLPSFIDESNNQFSLLSWNILLPNR